MPGVSRALRELNSRHHTAINMRIAGASPSAIAETLGVQRRTVYLWFGDPLVKRQLVSRTENVNDLIADRLAANALVGLDLLRTFAEEPCDTPVSPQLRLEAIRELLERHPLTNARAALASTDDHQSVFQAMDDHELAALLHRWAGAGSGEDPNDDAIARTVVRDEPETAQVAERTV
jgi:hypothetical protein